MLNELKQYLKIFLVETVCLILHIFWIFPVRGKQICFSAYSKKYCCNPKYIYEYLNENYGNSLFYVWIGNDTENRGNAHTIFVPYKSIKHIYYFLTSSLIISNTGFPGWIPYRKSQVLINTWHGGGAYKKVGIINCEKDIALYHLFLLKKIGARMDFFVSSCKTFSDVMSESFFTSAEFLPYGMPRNDLFFVNSLKKNIIKKKIGIDASTSVILYAPTFRGKAFKNNYNINNIGIDFPAVINVAVKKFNKNFTLLYRTHFVMKNINIDNNSYKNVTDYPDMQELLYIADILITDYSSSMWDYSLTFRPGFLFTPDIEEYKTDRDFYIPISEWPFPFAATNEQLYENILNFDEEENIRKIKRHHSMLVSYENGNAAKNISDLIMNLINK